ncbi:hypothetical protein [Oceanibium sediminis]|nr:hypothetical protein [Oceanibium sediminis]
MGRSLHFFGPGQQAIRAPNAHAALRLPQEHLARPGDAGVGRKPG